MSSFEPAKIISGLEALIGREHVSEDYVRFRIELLKAQTAVLDALAAQGPSSRVQSPESNLQSSRPSTLDSRLSTLDSRLSSLRGALLQRLFEDLSGALRKGRDRQSDDLQRLSAAAKNAELLKSLACQAAFGPDEASLVSLSRRLEVSFDALLFFGRVLAAPFVTDAAYRLPPTTYRLPPTASGGGCPFCGSPPGLARLRREEGQRVLCCSLCGESWQFARLACPFCGAEGELGVLCLEADDCRWIETCERCQGYLKTVDERKLPEGETVVPLVEAVATLYLDLIAEKKGYRRSMPYAALR